MKDNRMNNFTNFFNNSYLESIDADNDTLVFQKKYAGPLRMKIKGFGTLEEMYDATPGKIMLESSAMSEVLFLTKMLGNYNITKVGTDFIFENNGFAVVLERL
jgi:hypothetical protein